MKFTTLKTDRILFELKRQELKRWWVAEQVGVHRSTLRRWLSGEIKTVKEDTAGRLHQLLEIASTQHVK